VEFAVQGPDWDELAAQSKVVMDELEKTGLVTDLDTDYLEGMPEIRVIPDRNKAARHGVSVNSIAQTVNALVGGVIVGQFPKAGRLNDIYMRLEPDQRDRASQIKDLYVRNNRGELIRLSEVVTLEEKPSLQSINRINRQRSVSIFANVKAGKSQSDALDAAQAIGKKVLPAGYNVVLSGSSQSFKDAFGDLFMALIMGILVSYMVLASQFNSYIDPITVLMALPFSVSGAFLTLLIFGQSLSIFSMIGLILLMGIVKKNSILLVDFSNNVADEAHVHSAKQALLTACPIRFRPILMTSTATIAAALPPALGAGAGAETRIPMALAVIGGVLVSTTLTLFVVPCVYSLVSWMDKRFREHKMPADQGQLVEHPTIV
jgi:HAE1 family hydrophobic/amphiphilic exporter-1